MIQRLIIFIAFLLLPLSLYAAEPIPDDLIRIDENVEISAPVVGDVIALGKTIIIRGDVAGDVLAAGREVMIAGTVAGDVRVAAEKITITASVGGNVTAIARELIIGEQASIGKNISYLGHRLSMNGTIAGILRGESSITDVNGTIGGDIRLRSDALTLGERAFVGGTLDLTSDIALVTREGAVVKGEVQQKHPVSDVPTERSMVYLFGRIISLFSILLVGLVIVHAFRRPAFAIISTMINVPSKALGWGIVMTVLPPAIAIILFMTIIGIPLATILLVLWGALLYSARIFAALAIGFQVLWKFEATKSFQNVLWPLLLGTLILSIAQSIPVIGFVVTVLATWWGLGGFWLFTSSLSAVVMQEKRK